jgi:hypothetical protein
MKYVQHDVSLGEVLRHSGLAEEAGVRVSDVVDAELLVLGTVTVGVRVPVLWTAATSVVELFALQLPGGQGSGASGVHAATAAAAWLQENGSPSATHSTAEIPPRPSRNQQVHVQRVCQLAQQLLTLGLERVVLHGEARKLLTDVLMPLSLPVALNLLSAEDAAAFSGLPAVRVAASAAALREALSLQE